MGDGYHSRREEQTEYPRYYNRGLTDEYGSETPLELHETFSGSESERKTTEGLQGTRKIIQENQKGISFDSLLEVYLKNVRKIEVIDPDIRTDRQINAFVELLETIIKFKLEEEEIFLHLTTRDYKEEIQQQFLNEIARSCSTVGIHLSLDFKEDLSDSGCSLILDNGWKIFLSNGLDIFQRSEPNNVFSFSDRLPQLRPCKAFRGKLPFYPDSSGRNQIILFYPASKIFSLFLLFLFTRSAFFTSLFLDRVELPIAFYIDGVIVNLFLLLSKFLTNPF